MKFFCVSVVLIALSTASALRAQTVDPGRGAFESRCARCHGADGNGGERGPSITVRLTTHDDQQLAGLIRDGLPAGGMPPSDVATTEMADLVKFLRTIQRRPDARPLVRMTIQTDAGKTLDGQVLGEGLDDLQLLTDDHRVHLLRRAGTRFRDVTTERDWPTYNGDPGGNRYTTLTQITRANVARLAPKWMFAIPGTSRSQVTPVVVGGIMYVADVNECYALDAGTGRQVWHYKRPRTAAMINGVNRGVGVAGDRVFMETDDAHIIALNRFTGELLWDTTLDDWRKNYSATSAPLPAGNLVISGVTGASTAPTDSSRRTIRRPARKSGDSGPSRNPASRDRRRGKARTSSTAAHPRGSPAATTPRSTSSIGRPAIRARNTTAIIGRRQSLFRQHPGAGPQDRIAQVVLTSSRRTICGTGMPRRRPSS